MTFTYDTLVSAVMAYTENDGDEFIAAMPTIINTSEMELNRDLDNFGLVFHDYTSINVADAFLTKPTNTLVVKDLSIVVSGNYIPLRMRPLDFIRIYWPDRTSVGVPKYYANWDNDTLLLAPAPLSATTAEMTFTMAVSALSSAVSTNYLTDFCGNALLYKAIENSYLFMKNEAKAAVFKSKYQEERDRLLNEARRTRRDDMQAPDSQAGENTLTGKP